MKSIGELLQIVPVPAKIESTPSKNGELTVHESELSSALKSQRIEKSDIESIKQLLKKCMLKVGIRATNLPHNEEKEVLINHVIENYGGHTLSEIDLAFKMAITGKLDLESKEVNCYENFSCMYFSKIINAYRKWATNAIPNLPIKEPNQIVSYVLDWRGMIQKDYERHYLSDINYKILPVEYYDTLVSDGFIAPFVFKEVVEQCRIELCQEIQFEISSIRINPTKAEDDEDEREMYNKTKDLERVIVEYRSGKNELKVILRAKQLCVWVLFNEAVRIGKEKLYIKID